MWIALLALFYSLTPVFTFAVGLCRLVASLRRRRWDGGAWSGLMLVLLTLTGRWWVRLLRPAAEDEPKPLTPTHRGSTPGWGGVRLEWEQFGPDDAPAVLLAHGWSLTHDSWYYQKKALAGEFRVIVYDMRGMGRSAVPPDRDYSMQALVQDLAAIFRATDAGRHSRGCVLAGHSLGAMLLPLFAAQFPGLMTQVRGLALLAGTDIPLLQSMRGRGGLVPLQKPLWEPLTRLMGRCPWPFQAYAWLIWQMGAIHLADMFAFRVGHGSRGQTDLVAFHCAAVSMRAAGLGALSCFRSDARDAILHIDVPTLLLTGNHDPNMPPEVQRAMASRLRHAEMILFPDCGHLNLLECHEQVSTHLSAFARRCLAEKVFV
jgi:pimeloyl-ACP methyl ester carboxylesterase